MSELKAKDLAGDIVKALDDAVTTGFSKVRALAKTQSKQIAHHAKLIAHARLTGELKNDDDLFEFFTEQLKEMMATLARTVAAMTILTVEKAWNAIVKVVWGAINKLLAANGLAELVPAGKLKA